MATQYTSILRLALPTTGELDGTWGETVNDSITSLVEEAVAGRAVIDSWVANEHVLTTANGATSEARCAMLEFTDTGTALTGAGAVICPAASKIYIAKNESGQAITLKTSAGTGVAVPDGEVMFLFCDGTNVVEAITSVKTLKISDGVQVDTILDEDNMASDSATALATQQSIKAYIDTVASGLATAAQGALADSALQPGDNISELTNNSGYITTNQTITLSGDLTGSGTTSISAQIAADAVGAAEIADNAVGAAALNVSGNGTAGQVLKSDGDGSFTWGPDGGIVVSTSNDPSEIATGQALVTRSGSEWFAFDGSQYSASISITGGVSAQGIRPLTAYKGAGGKPISQIDAGDYSLDGMLGYNYNSNENEYDLYVFGKYRSENENIGGAPPTNLWFRVGKATNLITQFLTPNVFRSETLFSLQTNEFYVYDGSYDSQVGQPVGLATNYSNSNYQYGWRGVTAYKGNYGKPININNVNFGDYSFDGTIGFDYRNNRSDDYALYVFSRKRYEDDSNQGDGWYQIGGGGGGGGATIYTSAFSLANDTLTDGGIYMYRPNSNQWTYDDTDNNAAPVYIDNSFYTKTKLKPMTAYAGNGGKPIDVNSISNYQYDGTIGYDGSNGQVDVDYGLYIFNRRRYENEGYQGDGWYQIGGGGGGGVTTSSLEGTAMYFEDNIGNSLRIYVTSVIIFDEVGSPRMVIAGVVYSNDFSGSPGSSIDSTITLINPEPIGVNNIDIYGPDSAIFYVGSSSSQLNSDLSTYAAGDFFGVKLDLDGFGLDSSNWYSNWVSEAAVNAYSG